MVLWLAQDAAQAIDGLKAVHRQQTMWLRTKAALLANFSRKVRLELAEARSHAAELEVAAVEKEVAGLQDLLQQQQDFAGTLEQVCQVSIAVICKPINICVTACLCCRQHEAHVSPGVCPSNLSTTVAW